MTLDSSFGATYSEAAMKFRDAAGKAGAACRELLPIWPAAIGLQK
jgi:hypothetical protein